MLLNLLIVYKIYLNHKIMRVTIEQNIDNGTTIANKSSQHVQIRLRLRIFY